MAPIREANCYILLVVLSFYTSYLSELVGCVEEGVYLGERPD